MWNQNMYKSEWIFKWLLMSFNFVFICWVKCSWPTKFHFLVPSHPRNLLNCPKIYRWNVACSMNFLCFTIWTLNLIFVDRGKLSHYIYLDFGPQYFGSPCFWSFLINFKPIKPIKLKYSIHIYQIMFNININ